MNLDFEVVVFLPIYARKQANHNKSLVGLQIIIYLYDRQITRNNFVDKDKKANLSANTSQNFAVVWMRILASAGSTSHLLSFVSMWYSLFYFEKILKYLVQWFFTGSASPQGESINCHWGQNRCQKVFNRGLCVSAGWLCVCPGGLDIEKLTKMQLIIVFHISIWRCLELCLGGLSPPKKPVATGLIGARALVCVLQHGKPLNRKVFLQFTFLKSGRLEAQHNYLREAW